MTISCASSAKSLAAGWPLLLLGLIVTALVALYSEILFWIVTGWFSFTYSYSLLIMLISAYMIWNQKEKLAQTPIVPNLWLGGLWAGTGCVMAVAGKLSSTLAAQGIAMVATILGLILLTLGGRYLRLLFIPVGYLIFMFSLFEEGLSVFSSQLQRVAAQIAALILRSLGMPVLLKGNLIELPHITLEVAKVCNGVNHIVALLALAIPLAWISNHSRPVKAGIVAGSFLIGMLANGLRVAMIGLWTRYHPQGPTHGPFDIFYVSFILIFGLMLILLTRFFNPPPRSGGVHPASPSSLVDPAALGKFVASAPPRRRNAAIALALALLIVSNAYLYIHSSRPIEPRSDIAAFPMQIAGWEGKTVVDSGWPAKYLSADVELRRIYTHPNGDRLGLYIGYYQTQSQGRELINARQSWLYSEAAPVSLPAPGGRETILRGVARGLAAQTFAGDQRRFFFWHVIDGRVHLDPYVVKGRTLLNNLLHHRTNGAMVIVSTESPQDEAPEKREHVHRFLQDLLVEALKRL